MNPNTQSIEYKLKHFKSFNKFGFKRKAAPTKRQLDKFKANNDWEEFGNENLLVYRDYKTCYLTILKNKKGLYEPSVSGCKIDKYPDKVNLKGEYNCLDEAKLSAFMFVDKMTEENK